MNKHLGVIVGILLVLIVGAILIGKQYSRTVNDQTTAPRLEQPSSSGVVTNDALPEDVQTKTPVVDGAYVLQLETSGAQWFGSKTLIANYVDSGRIAVKAGSVVVSDGKVQEGSLVFDMTSIAAEKTGKNTGEDMLSSHLKSKDFFDVERYPESTFVIASVSTDNDQFMVSGTLTMKDVTEDIQVPVEAFMQEGKLIVRGVATVDRTKWGIKYGSDKFFDNLANNVIDDEFVLDFRLIFTPQL